MTPAAALEETLHSQFVDVPPGAIDGESAVAPSGSTAQVPVPLQAGRHIAVNADGKVLLASAAESLHVVGARAGVGLAVVPTGTRAVAVSFDSDERLIVAERRGVIRTYTCEPCGSSRQLRALVLRRLGAEPTTG